MTRAALHRARRVRGARRHPALDEGESYDYHDYRRLSVWCLPQIHFLSLLAQILLRFFFSIFGICRYHGAGAGVCRGGIYRMIFCRFGNVLVLHCGGCFGLWLWRLLPVIDFSGSFVCKASIDDYFNSFFFLVFLCSYLGRHSSY